MAHYFISFNDGDMKFPVEDFPAVAEASHAVMREAIDAGIWIYGGGFQGYSPRHVALTGEIVDGPIAQPNLWIGGFCVLDLPNDEEAMKWAHKIGVSCRCAQEVRRIMDDPEQSEALGKTR